MKEYDCEVHDDVLGNFCNSQTRHSFYVYRSAFSFRFVFVLFTECLRKHKFLCLCWNFSGGFGNTVVFSQFQRYYCQCMLQSCDLEYKIFDNCTSCLSKLTTKFGLKLTFLPGLAGSFGALLVGWLVVEARGLYLARHIFTLYCIKIYSNLQ